MTDLVARAIIQAIDRFSTPVRNMAGALAGFQQRSAAVASASKRVGSALAGPMAMGLGAVIYRTQEFEKKALGAKIATVADAMERYTDEFGREHMLVDHERIAREGNAIRDSALAMSKLLGVSPTGLMEAAEAAAKMGIELKKAEAVMRTSAILKMADPDIGYGQAAEFLGTLGMQFKAPKGVDDYAKWVTAAGDKIATVASATRTSVSKIEEGFRQFAGVFSSMGASVDQSASLIGAMTQGGLFDVEAGTALKSAALRFIKPTLPGLSALSSLGIDRRNYMDLTGADPRTATNQLMQMFTGYLNKKDRLQIIEMLNAAQKAGTGADPALIDNVAAFVNKRTGGKETIEDTYLKVLNAITTSGGKVDIFKYLTDLSKLERDGKMSDAQIGTIFEGRHINRMKTLFNQWDEVLRLMEIVTRVSGQGLNATQKEYSNSTYGQWEMAIASFDRALVRLRDSQALQSMVSGFESLADSLASLDSGKVEMIGQIAQALLALGAAGLTLSAAATVLGALTTATGVVAAFLALPFAPVAAGIVVLSAAIYGLYENWESIKGAFASAYDWATGKSKPADTSGLNPLAKTTDELIASINQPRELQVRGEATLKLDNVITVQIDQNGRPIVTGKQAPGAEARIPLKTGTSMPDVVAP